MPLVAIGARLRAICLALPEANEELMRRGPSYRVADKIFALERTWDDWRAIWCKVPEGSREILLEAEPGHAADRILGKHMSERDAHARDEDSQRQERRAAHHHPPPVC